MNYDHHLEQLLTFLIRRYLEKKRMCPIYRLFDFTWFASYQGRRNGAGQLNTSFGWLIFFLVLNFQKQHNHFCCFESFIFVSSENNHNKANQERIKNWLLNHKFPFHFVGFVFDYNFDSSVNQWSFGFSIVFVRASSLSWAVLDQSGLTDFKMVQVWKFISLTLKSKVFCFLFV